MLQRDAGQWYLFFRESTHNHEPSDPAAHPAHRKRSQETIATIQSLTDINNTPQQIYYALREKGVVITEGDIYNARKQYRKQRLNGKTPVQAVLEQLRDFVDSDIDDIDDEDQDLESVNINNRISGRDGLGDRKTYISRYQVDTNNQITWLFFAHPASINRLRRNPNILLMDTTYKTNRFGMPLFDIVGLDNMGKTFHVGFCFMSGEKDGDYIHPVSILKEIYDAYGLTLKCVITDAEKALKNAISEKFGDVPQLLCRWHINKNVLAQVQKTWNLRVGTTQEEVDELQGRRDEFMTRWRTIVEEYDVVKAEALWENLIAVYQGQAALCKYIRDTWYPMKEQFFLSYVKALPYYGQRDSSRVEGGHKTYLHSSTGDLFDVAEKIAMMIKTQRRKFKDLTAAQFDRIPHALKHPILEKLLGKVTHAGLRLILNQLNIMEAKTQANEVNELCRMTFRLSHGLPCHHLIRDLLALDPDAKLQLDHIDQHWHYQAAKPDHITVIDPMLLVQNPAQVFGKGRPKGALGGTKKGGIKPVQPSSSQEVSSQLSQPSQQSIQPSQRKKRATQQDKSTRRDLSEFEVIEVVTSATIAPNLQVNTAENTSSGRGGRGGRGGGAVARGGAAAAHNRGAVTRSSKRKRTDEDIE